LVEVLLAEFQFKVAFDVVLTMLEPHGGKSQLIYKLFDCLFCPFAEFAHLLK
jgi:hypothetical protein